VGCQIEDVANERKRIWTGWIRQSGTRPSRQVEVGRDDTNKRNQGVGDGHLSQGAGGQEGKREGRGGRCKNSVLVVVLKI
jgi:hypothetical protein